MQKTYKKCGVVVISEDVRFIRRIFTDLLRTFLSKIVCMDQSIHLSAYL